MAKESRHVVILMCCEAAGTIGIGISKKREGSEGCEWMSDGAHRLLKSKVQFDTF